ncbi:MAG: hypothetical protein HYV33_01370 [Candidatus Kerfeldbacteria bacterium]|nr:hypothetical protein [Candidatus Kerfeldbacteria bacterium]
MESNRWLQFIERYYSLLATLVVVGVIIIGSSTLLLPQYNRLQQSGVLEYDNTLQALQERQQYVHNLAVMSENYQQLDLRLLRLIDVVLPPQYNRATVFAELEATLDDSNISVQSINVAAAPTTASDTTTMVESINLTVNASLVDSSYPAFKQLLQHIESTSHLLDLQVVTYTPSNQSLTLQLKTYARR